ncbi:MAG TPA: LLM class flavin-dependent oxidoreductase [Acidobacteriota bacterium]|nr:LLM class flavin-dependent oxidoreductase [Acidobacteriota bacterium]
MATSTVKFDGEIGIHFPLHVLNRYSLPELISLAERAWQTMGPFGFTRVWTNDNLEYRSVLASSAAILSRVPVKLGTAVTVPYFRNPVDVAMAFATISELTDGKEISLGLGPGSRSILTRHVVRTKPLTIMAEFAVALRTLFAGETLNRRDIPTLADYFHLNTDHYTLRFRTPAPIHLYYGPSLLKPAVLDLVARHFDGVVLQTLYGIDDMEMSLARLNSARAAHRSLPPLRKTMLLNASISRDGQTAKQHAKRFISHIASGWPDDVLEAKGIDPKAIQAVRQAYAENRGVDYAAALTPDHAVDRLIINGTPAQCVERLRELFSLAVRHGFSEIAIGVPLGPDVPEAIDLWGKEVLPALK